MLVDLHNHTVDASDGHLDRLTLVRLAKMRGVDAIAITDHDFILPAATAAELTRRTGILVVPGMERTVRAADGTVIAHFLCYGVCNRDGSAERQFKQELFAGIDQYRGERQRRRPDISLPDLAIETVHYRHHLLNQLAGRHGTTELAGGLPTAPQELIDAVHAMGGLVVWAHPFTLPRVFRDRVTGILGLDRGPPGPDLDLETALRHLQDHDPGWWRVLTTLDGIECRSCSIGFDTIDGKLCERLARLLGKPMLATSAAHGPKDVASAAIRLGTRVSDEAGLLAGLRSGAVEPVTLYRRA